jgi:hypothetical protein
VTFDLIVEKEPFVTGMDTLEKAVSSLLHVTFVANMHYPKVKLPSCLKGLSGEM